MLKEKQKKIAYLVKNNKQWLLNVKFYCTSVLKRLQLITSLESTAAYMMSIQPLKVACSDRERSLKISSFFPQDVPSDYATLISFLTTCSRDR